MNYFKYIFLFLLFANSSLFATAVNVSFGVGLSGFPINTKLLYIDQYNNNYILTFTNSPNIFSGSSSTNAVYQTETIDFSTNAYIYTQSDGTTYSENDQQFSYVNATSCSSGLVLDINTNSCVTPAPTCTDTQYLDSNNTCQEKIIPPGFPDSSKKGIPGIREDNTTAPADCIVGTKIDTGIAHAEIIGYNYQTNACIYSTFFCNNGLTWSKLDGSCIVPPDNANFNPDNGEISQELASACTSGKWAKSWTYDYCAQPLCYISLDVQDYNLQCNNKYIEYDCTSDYRVKTFKQVSCGDIAKSDFNQNDLQITPINNVPPKNPTPIESNSTTKQIDANTSITDYTPITQRLDLIIDEQKTTNSKLNVLSKESTQLDILKNIKSLIDKQPSKQDIQDAMNNALKDNNNSLSKKDISDAVLDALNRHDSNGTGDANGTVDTNGTGDANATGTGLGNYMSGILNEQYSKSYNVFNISSSGCGTPSFDPDITFMGFTVANPLPIMEAHVSQYYDGIKIFVILSATLLGLLTIFRR